MSLADAIRADEEGSVQEAAALYEAALAGSVAKPLDALLNLAVLYWQVTDYGYLTNRGLSAGFAGDAGKRFVEVLADARRLYPESAEVRFWERYIRWADLGEAFPPEDCADLLREDPSSLTPAMHGFVVTQGKEYEAEARELLARCGAVRTVRANYVASVIRGTLKRLGRA